MTANLLSGSLYVFARLTGPFGITLAEVTHDFVQWRKDKISRQEIAAEVFSGDEFCNTRLNTAPAGGLEDVLLCMCSDDPCDRFADYCEDPRPPECF